LSRLKKTLAALVTASLLMVMMASPSFAFIHAFIPAGECATSEQAGDNPTAAEEVPRIPVETPPAPDTCPAP
jgi:hypothetical protein